MQLGIQLGTAHATHSRGGGRGKMQIEREPTSQDDLAVKHLDGAGWGNAQLSKNILGAFFQVGINAGIDGGGTKTECVLMNLKGEVISTSLFGSLNMNSRPVAEMAESIIFFTEFSLKSSQILFAASKTVPSLETTTSAKAR